MAGYEETFARYYDALTADVDYRGHGAYLKSLAEQYGGRFRLVLDLACGTGSLAVELARLGAEEGQIVLLHAVTGLKHREIAQLLELPLSTVLSKYHRGLKKLKALMKGESDR